MLITWSKRNVRIRKRKIEQQNEKRFIDTLKEGIKKSNKKARDAWRENGPQINVRKSNSSTTSMERRRRMGTHFFDLMNIDSFQQEAIDIDRREYISPRTNIKLSFHGDRVLSSAIQPPYVIHTVLYRSNCQTSSTTKERRIRKTNNSAKKKHHRLVIPIERDVPSSIGRARHPNESKLCRSHSTPIIASARLYALRRSKKSR